jgi:hypothetical protein
MEEEVARYLVALPPDDDDMASTHANGVLSGLSEPTFVTKPLPSMHDAVRLLLDGDVDLIAVSATQWSSMDKTGLTVASALGRREPTWVLVADDRPDMLEHGARVGCDHPLLHRQLRRFRPDLSLVNPNDEDPSWCTLPAAERVSRWEEQRTSGDLHGYVIPRSMHRCLEGRPPRRHTLGLYREDPTRHRFVPPPLGGFTLLVARSGFPAAPLRPISDVGALLAHRLERAILEAIPEHLQSMTGVHVERRRVGTLLQEAAKVEDEHAIESLLDPEASLKTKGHRLEIIVETLGVDGRGAAASERVFPEAEAHSGMVRALEEWSELLDAMTTDHEELGRGVHYMGEFEEAYAAAHPSMMRLEEE